MNAPATPTMPTLPIWLLAIHPNATVETWHQHPNGGGWVENTATVADSAYLGDSSAVYGDAWVSGNAWVYGNAQVYGNARVYGNAQVYGNARVYGNAWVSGDARVSGNARVSGDARVYGDAWAASPLYIQGSRHPLTTSSLTTLTIGFTTRTMLEWEAQYKEIGIENGYTPEQIEEYGQYIALCLLRYPQAN